MPCIDFLKDLIEIPSLSGEEQNLAERVKKEFKKLDYDQIIQSGGNVCGVKGSGPLVILYDAHMDIVAPGKNWERDPYKAIEREGYIYGRGACDDKASLASIIYGGSQLDNKDVTLYVLASVNEEVSEGNGLKNFLKQTAVAPEYIVIAEPSSMRIARGNRGRLEIKLEVFGTAGHASRPEHSVNAIYRAQTAIENIMNLNESLVDETVVVTKIESANDNLNVIPERCDIYCDYRSSAGTTEKNIINKLKSCVDKTDKVFSISPYYVPWATPSESAIVKSANLCLGSIMPEGETIVWDFCTNGSYTAGELGITTIGFGPGFENDAHTVSEKVKIESVEKAVQFYAEFPKYLHKELSQ